MGGGSSGPITSKAVACFQPRNSRYRQANPPNPRCEHCGTADNVSGKSFVGGSWIPLCKVCCREIDASSARSSGKQWRPAPFVSSVKCCPRTRSQIIASFLRGNDEWRFLEASEPSIHVQKDRDRTSASAHRVIDDQMPQTHGHLLDRERRGQPETVFASMQTTQEQVPEHRNSESGKKASDVATENVAQVFESENKWEILSWKYCAEDESGSAPDLALSIGQRHCRFGRCACIQFQEDRSRKTVCVCGHGEMYHRSHSEAPLARVKVKGDGNCAHCQKPIVHRAFSGWYKEIKSDGSIVHDECWDVFQDSRATKCDHCKLPIRKISGLHQHFSGRFNKIKIDGHRYKVHKECTISFMTEKGEVCDYCGKPLLSEYLMIGTGAGSNSGTERVHRSCWERTDRRQTTAGESKVYEPH